MPAEAKWIIQRCIADATSASLQGFNTEMAQRLMPAPPGNLSTNKMHSLPGFRQSVTGKGQLGRLCRVVSDREALGEFARTELRDGSIAPALTRLP